MMLTFFSLTNCMTDLTYKMNVYVIRTTYRSVDCKGRSSHMSRLLSLHICTFFQITTLFKIRMLFSIAILINKAIIKTSKIRVLHIWFTVKGYFFYNVTTAAAAAAAPAPPPHCRSLWASPKSNITLVDWGKIEI